MPSGTRTIPKPLWFMWKYILNIVLIMPVGLSSAQDLIDSRLSDCDINSFPELVKHRVSKKELLDDTLFLSIGFSANCCIEPKPLIEYSNDTLYITKNNVSNEWCACDCCFELDLQLSGFRDTNFVVIVDSREFKSSASPHVKLPDEYRFNRKTPINQGNRDNLKIGLWRTYYENSNKIKSEEYFSEDWEDPIRVWYKTYDQKGKLTSVGIRTSPTGDMIVLEPKMYYRILNSKP